MDSLALLQTTIKPVQRTLIKVIVDANHCGDPVTNGDMGANLHSTTCIDAPNFYPKTVINELWV
jgi:hypothetical protein